MAVSKSDILKNILLNELEGTEVKMTSFEEDPMQFILKKYAGLKTVLEYLMTPSFEEYVDAIFIVAPKPTTFKVLLHNGQFFFLQFMGKAYQATVAGKNYYLMTIGEKERCMLAIARLLRFGNPLKTKGPEGAEQGTRPEGEEGGEGGEAGAEVPEATPEEGGEELAESKILESILKKSLYEKKETTKNPQLEKSKLVKQTIQKILQDQKSKELGLTAMGKPGRIANLAKITSDQFVELIKSIFGEKTEIAIYKPNEGPNTGKKGSSKFKMYQFAPTNNSVPVEIILAGGANEGEKFEAELFNSTKSFAGESIENITDPLVKQLYEKTNIDPSKIKPEDIQSTGKNNTNRSLDWSGPKNIGEKIADITIKEGNKSNYLSIKDTKGGNFYNGGTIPFIVQDKEGNISYDESKRSSKPQLDRLFKDLGIDPNKIVEGLKQYKKEGESSQYQTAIKKQGEKSQNLEDFKKFLASGYGYGYWYVRKKAKGELFVKFLATEQDAMDMIGNISEVQIKYPGPNTKTTTIKVITDDKSILDTDYIIELRNDHKDIIPISLKMKSTK